MNAIISRYRNRVNIIDFKLEYRRDTGKHSFQVPARIQLLDNVCTEQANLKLMP